MGMMDLARRDAKFILSEKENGFAVDLVLTDPNAVEASITGLHTKKWLKYDLDRGAQVDHKLVHISFSEEVLITAAPTYAYRNAKGDVDMLNHTCRATDSTGVEYLYKVREAHSNETLGMIVCTFEQMEE